MTHGKWISSRTLLVCLAGAFAFQLTAARSIAREPSTGETVAPAAREEKTKRHEEINQRVKDMPNARILFIGDSITQGWESNGKEVWEKYYGKRNVLNLGVSGDRTQHVLWRLDHGNIDGLNPKVAVIMIGTNNIGKNDPKEIADGILAINAKLKVKLPTTKVVVLAIFPRSPTQDDPKRHAVARTNEILKEHEGTTGYRYVDIGREFLQPDGSISKEIMPDYLHLSPKGYEIWAKSIEPVLANIVGPLQ